MEGRRERPFLKGLSDVLLSLALVLAIVAAFAWQTGAASTALLSAIACAFALLAGYAVRP